MATQECLMSPFIQYFDQGTKFELESPVCYQTLFTVVASSHTSSSALMGHTGTQLFFEMISAEEGLIRLLRR